MRVRARPALFDAYIAQARAKAQAADASFSGTLLPNDRDVEGFLLGCMRRAEAAAVAAAASAAGAAGASGAASAPSAAAAGRERSAAVEAGGELTVGTMALLQGLRAAGFAASKEHVAVLRSAFRLRQPAAGAAAAAATDASAAGEREHAAILALPLAQFLTRDEPTATQMLIAVDEMASHRSGRVRPPVPGGAGGGGFGGGSSGGGYGGGYDGGGVGATPLPAGSFGGFGAASPAPFSGFAQSAAFGTPARGGFASSAILSSGMSGVGGRAGAYGGAAPAGAPPLSSSVGEWVAAQATAAERENLALLGRALQDFAARTGVPQAAPPAVGATVADGADSLVLCLGPRLKVGLRVYV